jgi:hypothetical protein
LRGSQNDLASQHFLSGVRQSEAKTSSKKRSEKQVAGGGGNLLRCNKTIARIATDRSIAKKSKHSSKLS